MALVKCECVADGFERREGDGPGGLLGGLISTWESEGRSQPRGHSAQREKVGAAEGEGEGRKRVRVDLREAGAVPGTPP